MWRRDGGCRTILRPVSSILALQPRPQTARQSMSRTRKLAIEGDEVRFEEETDEQDVAGLLRPGVVAAVTQGTDWTTETIVAQLRRGNIQLNPRFQRRDAWKQDRKSRFIESLIVGLPIPQIVLAESKTERGKFIVLDGKQRLLSILQFWGAGQGASNAYALSGLTLREDLKRKTFLDLSTNADFENDYNALCNQPIRTVVMRNWRDSNFLHTVFLRLNTGSVNLSPQELRQALLPGAFSDYIDDAACQSEALQRLLGLSAPDARMRDIEVLARFLAFRFFAAVYPGRMKEFLDNTFDEFNKKWSKYESKISKAQEDFDAGVADLLRIFGDELARKPGSRQFNRAIFDALIFFQSQPRVRAAVRPKQAKVVAAYRTLFSESSTFLKSIESDTAGAPNTSTRLRVWAETLENVTGQRFHAPTIPLATTGQPRRRKAGTKTRTKH